MRLTLQHPAGFSANVVYDGDVWVEGELKKVNSMGGPTTTDGRMWYFHVTVQGDHGQRGIREITGGRATLIREDDGKHAVGYTAPELQDLSDGKVLKLSSSRNTIEAFLAGD